VGFFFFQYGEKSMSAETPVYERVTDDMSSILDDMRTTYHQQQTASDAGQQQATEQGQQQTQVTEPPPQATEPPPPQAAEQANAQTQQQQATDTQTTAATPPPPADTSTLIPSPESHLAPLFELSSLPPEQAMPQAVEVMKGFYQYDPVAYTVLANAVLQASPQSAAKLVLEANGIPTEKVSEV
jgi:hypothetical protein